MIVKLILLKTTLQNTLTSCHYVPCFSKFAILGAGGRSAVHGSICPALDNACGLQRINDVVAKQWSFVADGWGSADETLLGAEEGPRFPRIIS